MSGDATGGAPSPSPTAPPVTPRAAGPDDDDMLEVGEGQVRKLTRYERGLRGKLTAAEAAAAEAARLRDEGVRAAQAERDQAVASATAAANARIVRAELKALALKAGMLDPADLAHVDVSALKLTDAGDVDGAAAFIEALKTSKPHWFTPATGAATGTTASTAKLPPAADGKPKSAKDMTPDEYKAAKAAMTRR